ncbi:MAG: hypothetical protein ACREEM_49540, partial [Blastocatellia bacterium]
MGIRAAADLWRWRKYRKTMKVYKPIAETLEMDVPYLDEIAEHPDFRLPDPDQTDLNERIARGCRNIEERSLFVTRSFARFMRLMEVRFQSFAMAMLRYLTVRRYVTTSGGFGTYRMFQCPIVPVWNLRLFPLYPPSGFANLIDPLLLDSEWDIVQTCGRCGGTGQVWETYYETEYYTEHYTEYYTDYNGRQSSRPASRTATRQVAKQRQVTCPACGGSGRVLYRQTLNTQWQSLMPIVTHPRMPMPELVENAEEKSYFHLPLTEDFHDLPPSPNSYGIVNALVKRMEESATYVVSRHTINTEKVEKLHNGKLYRADFQICGFRTISIRFAKLRGRIGWFFGKRPEFYFPRLPLCYATLGTMIFLPPLVVGLAVWMAQVAVTMVAKP